MALTLKTQRINLSGIYTYRNCLSQLIIPCRTSTERTRRKASSKASLKALANKGSLLNKGALPNRGPSAKEALLDYSGTTNVDSVEKAFLQIFGRPDDRDARDLNELVNPENPNKDTAHHLHVLATKHNTHITLTNPDRNPVMSLSTGNIGFKKAARGTYDAAYQLAAYLLGNAKERGLVNEITSLEVVLRGFGIGREAVTKALMGTEGRYIRAKILRVTDATRLKFGGTRGEKPRRLG